MRYFLGGDPGYQNGALCYLSEDFKTVEFFDISINVSDLCAWVFERSTKVSFAVLERVHAMPLQGVVSSFNFGRGFGWTEAVLAAACIPHEVLDPQRWQALVSGRPLPQKIPNKLIQSEHAKLRRQARKENKKAIFTWAKNKFPEANLSSLAKDSNRADALGIAYYAWYHYRSLNAAHTVSHVA